MWQKRSRLLLAFAWFALGLVFSPAVWPQTVREEATQNLLDIEILLLNSLQREIELEQTLRQLETDLRTTKERSASDLKALSAQLKEVSDSLERQQAISAELSTLYEKALKSQAALKTENDILWGVLGGIGIGAFVYGVATGDQVLCWAGAGIAAVTAGRFAIKIIF